MANTDQVTSPTFIVRGCFASGDRFARMPRVGAGREDLKRQIRFALQHNQDDRLAELVETYLRTK